LIISKNLKNNFFHTWKNLQHFEEISSTPPTHLKVLQSPCMDYHFLCNLANSKPFLKRILPFYVIQAKPLITSCSNTMSFLLFGVGP
jgi:hypothetical protein